MNSTINSSLEHAIAVINSNDRSWTARGMMQQLKIRLQSAIHNSSLSDARPTSYLTVSAYCHKIQQMADFLHTNDQIASGERGALWKMKQMTDLLSRACIGSDLEDSIFRLMYRYSQDNEWDQPAFDDLTATVSLLTPSGENKAVRSGARWWVGWL